MCAQTDDMRLYRTFILESVQFHDDLRNGRRQNELTLVLTVYN